MDQLITSIAKLHEIIINIEFFANSKNTENEREYIQQQWRWNVGWGTAFELVTHNIWGLLESDTNRNRDGVLFVEAGARKMEKFNGSVRGMWKKCKKFGRCPSIEMYRDD